MPATKLLFVVGLAMALTSPTLATPPATLTTLYSFKGYPDDGLNPEAKLFYQGGLLYGTTSAGGTNGYGTVFKINPKRGTEAILYALNTNVGSGPRAGLINLSDELYGTAEGGGLSGTGSVFTVNPKTGAGSAVYEFGIPPDAAFPDGELLLIKNELYGVTQYGGSSTRYGAIYKINPASKTEALLYSFKGGTDGATPFGALINESQNLFGTTQTGGSSNTGTIYKVNIHSGAEKVLYSFKGGTDGEFPDSGLVEKGGALYGTTYAGGAQGFGTVFKVGRDNDEETVIYSFGGGSDGANPVAGLLLVRGSLYGTTSGGGLGYGTVFSIDLKSGTETILHSFTGGDDGANPVSALIYQSGKLYGTTQAGGTVGGGTVFEIDP